MTRTTEAHQTRDVVVIGSSAGGLNALTVVLSAFPADLAAIVLAVQHLDPRVESHMARILERRCRVQVSEARDGEVLARGTVYIALPDRHMLVEGDRIRLTQTEPLHFVRPSVDLLFESAAATYGSRVVAVILTGSGVDGALGVTAIKEHGGLTIVQDPETAQTNSMPRAAIATGAADLILPLDQIGPEVVRAVSPEETDV